MGDTGSRLAKQPLHRTKSSSRGIDIAEPNSDTLAENRNFVSGFNSPTRVHVLFMQDVGIAFVGKV